VGRRARLSFEAITVEEWNAIIATNRSGAFYIAHQTVPAMHERGWGRFIHISGLDGFAEPIPERTQDGQADLDQPPRLRVVQESALISRDWRAISPS
jgi:NAD(P)-dependent dehydrogenase (short-subunit alcohol dehydrogenase family)